MRTFLISLFFVCSWCISVFSQDQVYELRTYELEVFRPAELLNSYLRDALIPALNRQGISPIGVFEENGESLPAKIYVLIPYKNIQSFQNSKDILQEDENYKSAANSYFASSDTSIPFNRYTSNLIRSSKGFPELTKPSEKTGLFELRIYESKNEDALRRKVKMFDDSEFDIFKDVGLSTVFFGYNIAGTNIPCLTYLLAFTDMQTHNEAWSRFGQHPEWQRITKLDDYADAMNNIIRVYLRPVDYSQL